MVETMIDHAVVQVDVTYRDGKTDHFEQVTDFRNDGTAIEFKGRKKDADGNLGPLSTWWNPVANTVRSVATREGEDGDD